MIKKLVTFIFLTLTISNLTGCSIYHVNSKDTTSNYYPPKSHVDVIYVENITQSHEVIGKVTVNTERRQRFDEIISNMKREAAILGGDAITNLQTNASGIWKRLPAQNVVGNAYVRANFTAEVVVFK